MAHHAACHTHEEHIHPERCPSPKVYLGKCISQPEALRVFEPFSPDRRRLCRGPFIHNQRGVPSSSC